MPVDFLLQNPRPHGHGRAPARNTELGRAKHDIRSEVTLTSRSGEQIVALPPDCWALDEVRLRPSSMNQKADTP